MSALRGSVEKHCEAAGKALKDFSRGLCHACFFRRWGHSRLTPESSRYTPKGRRSTCASTAVEIQAPSRAAAAAGGRIIVPKQANNGVTAAVALGNHVSSGPVRLIVGMIVGALFAALVGFLIGIPVLRLKGDYLAIVTLAFGEIIKGIFNNLFVGIDSSGLHVSLLSDKTNLAEDGQLVIGGPMGLQSIPRLSNFVIGVILVLITLIIVFHLVNSRSGRAIMAVRDNRIAAESVGINVTKYKLMAFTVSAALAGAAGTLFAMNYTTIVANKFDFNTSILILVFVVLGGLGNMWGSVIAAAALTILPEALRQFADYRMLVYAIVLILVMLATNNPAIWGFFARLRERREEKKGGAAQ